MANRDRKVLPVVSGGCAICWAQIPDHSGDGLNAVRCSHCPRRAEKVPLLPSDAPVSKRFEAGVESACESAAASRAARQFSLAASAVPAFD